MKNKINNEHIIRTIKLIGSRFFIKKAGQVVTVFAPPWRDFVSASRRILNFCSCTQDRFVMEDKPGQCHCNTINFVTGDKYIVRIKIVPLTLTFDSVRAFGVTAYWLKYHNSTGAASGNTPPRQVGPVAATSTFWLFAKNTNLVFY